MGAGGLSKGDANGAHPVPRSPGREPGVLAETTRQYGPPRGKLTQNPSATTLERTTKYLSFVAAGFIAGGSTNADKGLAFQGPRAQTPSFVANRLQQVTKEDILQLLSEGEVASVGAANAKAQLGNGDEYLDLEQLQQGVQRAKVGLTPMGRVLPRKAIYEDTWRRVLRQLKATPV
jgi:hypothetical protein